jgi:hypothetical protein
LGQKNEIWDGAGHKWNINEDGSADVKLTGRTTGIAGKTTVTTAGTPVSLGSQLCGEGIYVTANPDNVGNVYVYPVDGAKTDVIALEPGDTDVWNVSNISALMVDADTSGDSVYWKGAV